MTAFRLARKPEVSSDTAVFSKMPFMDFRDSLIMVPLGVGELMCN